MFNKSPPPCPIKQPNKSHFRALINESLFNIAFLIACCSSSFKKTISSGDLFSEIPFIFLTCDDISISFLEASMQIVLIFAMFFYAAPLF